MRRLSSRLLGSTDFEHERAGTVIHGASSKLSNLYRAVTVLCSLSMASNVLDVLKLPRCELRS